MKDIKESSSEYQLKYNLDSFGLLTIEKMYKWTKFVGIMNIITGVIYCLSIVILSIPTVIMGIVTIIMGTKLTTAASHLEFAVQNQDSATFITAIDKLRQYFLINGILLIITIVIIGLILIFMSLFAGYIMDFLNESGFDYSISAFQTISYSINS